MHDFICILTGSPGYFLFIIIYVIHKIEGNDNSPVSFNVMVNYHYHSESRVINPVILVYATQKSNYQKEIVSEKNDIDELPEGTFFLLV